MQAFLPIELSGRQTQRQTHMGEKLDWQHVEDVSEEYTGEAHHIRLNEAVEVTGIFDGGVRHETADFIISATSSLGRPETYAFVADEDGEVKTWGEVISAGEGLVSQKDTHDWEMVAEELAKAASGEGLKA